MVEVRLAAHGVLLPSQDPVYGLVDLLLRWGGQRWDDGDVAVQSELLLHHIQFDQEGPPLLGAGLPVLLQLVAEPGEAAADATCKQIGSPAPLAGERLARQLCHLLREGLIFIL